MTQIESKIGTINNSAEKIYSFLSDFNNFKNFVPPDKVKNWQSTQDTCQFEIEGIGIVGLKIIEREPFTTIKLTGEGKTPFDFFFWAQLKETNSSDTKIKLTVKADLNPMFKMIVEKPLTNALNTLIDQLCKLDFNSLV